MDALKEEVPVSHVCCPSDSKVKSDSSVICSVLLNTKVCETDELAKSPGEEILELVAAGDSVVSKV